MTRLARHNIICGIRYNKQIDPVHVFKYTLHIYSTQYEGLRIYTRIFKYFDGFKMIYAEAYCTDARKC
jgi:hypothetical protein